MFLTHDVNELTKKGSGMLFEKELRETTEFYVEEKRKEQVCKEKSAQIEKLHLLFGQVCGKHTKDFQTFFNTKFYRTEETVSTYELSIHDKVTKLELVSQLDGDYMTVILRVDSYASNKYSVEQLDRNENNTLDSLEVAEEKMEKMLKKAFKLAYNPGFYLLSEAK